MGFAVICAVLCLAVPQDPSDQLRRDELNLRLHDLAESEKLDAFSRAVLRELRGKRIDGPLLEQCWRPVGRRNWDGTVDRLLEAWDKAAAAEAPAPAPALYRVRLEQLARPKAAREKLEEAVRRFPDEPMILWAAGKARYESAEYGPAAGALEAMAAQKSAAFEVDDFHRMLARCYAETDREAAAIEHLRAIGEASAEVRDVAALAVKCRLHAEAARLYRVAFDLEPERTSLRLSIIASLAAAGETAQAAAERRKIFEVDGALRVVNVEEYFYLLPPEGRSAEIVTTLRQLLEAKPDGVAKMTQLVSLARTVPGECRGSVMTQWEGSAGEPLDVALLACLKRNWGPRADALECLEAAEKRFPKNPWILREKIEALDALGRFKDVGETYGALVETDPGGQTGPRPYPQLARAVRGLGDLDPSAAMALALRSLLEPGGETTAREEMRGALRSTWDKSGPAVWEELRKHKPPRPSADVEAQARRWVEKLSADEFEERTQATAELKKLGMAAAPVVIGALDDKDAEVRSRVREVLRSLFID
jgi:tetratricopeptide (TPR) repeat protein